jgi:hypothetical protein
VAHSCKLEFCAQPASYPDYWLLVASLPACMHLHTPRSTTAQPSSPCIAPRPPPKKNPATQAFLRTYGRGLRPPATGADDAQADCIARLVPLVSMFAGDPRLMEFTAAATRVTQDTVTAVAWACAGAAVLERLLLGRGAAAAVRETVQELQQEGPGGRVTLDCQETHWVPLGCIS